MKSFNLYTKHIPGTQNKVADWLSRLEKYYETNTLFETDFDPVDMIHAHVCRSARRSAPSQRCTLDMAIGKQTVSRSQNEV